MQGIKAIVFTTNTGTTEQYARLLAEKIDLPVYSAKEAAAAVAEGSTIIYMGWLMAAGVKGYKAAAKTYKIAAVCAVGMGTSGEQLEEVRKANALPDDFPLFTVQGGLQKKKLHGIYKLVIAMVTNAAAKSLRTKPNRTPEDETMLQLVEKGGNCVSEANLKPLLDWYETQSN